MLLANSKKIAVVAANGRTGKAFVEQALTAGHIVRAGIHRTNNLNPHPNLTVITCDATKAAEVMELIKDQDAVVSFIGHVKGSPAHVQTESTQVIISAMESMGIRRIVSLTGTGVRFEGDEITMIDRILNSIIEIIDPSRIKDGRDHVKLLKKSNLDWTIVRVLKLTDGPKRPFLLLKHGPTKLFVSRKDVATATLEVITNGSFIKEAPILGKS